MNGIGLDGGAEPQQCTPSSGSCLCTAANTGQMISCENTNSLGTCMGHRTCDGINGYGACDAKTPEAETCNGLDDNCNGMTDEGLGMTHCGVGACERIVNACIAGSPSTCTPGNPTTEVCNGIDDDCDGVVDNGFNLSSSVNSCGSCTNVCMLSHATPKCVQSVCEVDTCDANYGNCNHLDPDGCETNLLGDVNNCAACGHACQFPNAVPSCTNGTCGFTCVTGFIDLDQDPSNGCEYACTFQSAVDLPDMAFVDANCDGIDGEVTNGIFVASVAAGGNDANPGTRAQPVVTVAKALQLATTQNKRDVYVAAGTYGSQLLVTNVSGKIIAGGYAAPTWRRSLVNTTTFAQHEPGAEGRGRRWRHAAVHHLPRGERSTNAGDSAYGAWVESSTVTLEALSITAGTGANGVDGTNGTYGTVGGNGGAGDRGCEYDPSIGPDLCGQCTEPSVGTPGASSCGEPGGAGGTPGWSIDAPAGNGATGSPGSGGALGGIATAIESGDAGTGPLTAGQDGVDGTNGTNGTGGLGLGSVSDAGYSLANALPGLTATNGRSGGGGGGGGGGCGNDLLGLNLFCLCFSYGSSGGIGGAGGCAGGVGLSGGGGGASIALYEWQSNVTATNVAFTTSNGGNGGKGGLGAPGGLGGLGATSNLDPGQQGDSGRGGKGGKGGKGGTSGHGGGGGGGPSLGVARDAASGFVGTNVSSTLGSGGLGGTSLGNAGQSGTVASEHAF